VGWLACGEGEDGSWEKAGSGAQGALAVSVPPGSGVKEKQAGMQQPCDPCTGEAGAGLLSSPFAQCISVTTCLGPRAPEREKTTSLSYWWDCEVQDSAACS
jgi:hypothetical protein